VQSQGKDKIIPTLQLSYLHFVKGDLDKAFVFASDALRIAPNDPEVMLRFIFVGFKCNKIQEVVPVISRFHEQHPDRHEIWTIKTEEAPEFLKKLQERATFLERAYREKPFPLCFIERFSPLSLFELWHTIAESGSPEVCVHFHSGEIRTAEEATTAKSDGRIVIDPLALLSLSLLNRLDLLEWGFTRIIVSRDIIGIIDFERIQALDKYLSPIKSFLTRSSKVSMLQPKRRCDLPPDVREAFGTSYAALFDLAEQESVALYSDETGIRDIARERAIPTFSTRGLLQHAWNEGRVTWDELNECLIKLANHNYYIVLVDKDNLYWSAERYDFQMNENTRTLLNGIFAFSPNIQYFSDLFSDFISKLWSDAPPERKHRLNEYFVTCANLISIRSAHERAKEVKRFIGSALLKVANTKPEELKSLLDVIFVYVMTSITRDPSKMTDVTGDFCTRWNEREST
jgi:predicted nucleic acid-binding protein